MDSRSERRGSAQFRVGLMGVAIASLASCSLILDFEKKDLAADDAGLPDAEVVDIDAEVIVDAAPPDANTADCEALEPNDSLGTAIPVVGGDTDAAVCPGNDQDFYQFDLAANTDLILTLTADEGRPDANLDLRLFDAMGNLQTEAIGTENPEVISHTDAAGNALPAGTYAIQVSSDDADLEVSYQLNIQLVPVVVP